MNRAWHESGANGYNPTMTTADHEPNDEPTTDPRMQEPDGDRGIPGEVIDTAHNMPGDQPEDDTPPSRTKATGRE